MPKRREPRIQTEPTPEQVEAFALGADSLDEQSKKEELDPSAIRDFKAIRVPFNEYEYKRLEEGSRKTGRTKLNFLRYAMLKAVKEVSAEE